MITTTATIRAARRQDAPRLAALSCELGYAASAEEIRGRLTRLSRDGHLVLVAECVASGVVAWVHAAEQPLLVSKHRCEILGLVVGTGARRQGIGRALVDAVERWAGDRGLTEIAVRSNVLRPESHAFYERLGYSRVKTQHAYRRRVVEASGVEGSRARSRSRRIARER